MIDFSGLKKAVQAGRSVTRDEAMQLLQCSNHGGDYHKLIALSDETSRKVYNSRGYVFAQIGLNAKPCVGGCKFCSLSLTNYSVGCEHEIGENELYDTVRRVAQTPVSDLFLMTTADYDKNKFLQLAVKVKEIAGHLRLVANIGDFDYEYALRLKDAGIYAAYHIVRMREGDDTDISVKIREKTIDAIVKSGLKLYYCVEPIGSEHSYNEILDEAERAKNLSVDVMAVMRRVNLPQSPLSIYPEITDSELIKIAAVVRLFVMPKISMNVHEVTQGSLMAGVNQLYAEIGVNPRDTEIATEKNRGVGIEGAVKLLRRFEYEI